MRRCSTASLRRRPNSLSDPRPSGCRKLAGTDDRYRIRVGNYRIIYRIDDGRVAVLVLVIGHRREVYG